MIQGPDVALGVSWRRSACSLVGAVGGKGVGDVGPER
jgi:hypothetical protein